MNIFLIVAACMAAIAAAAVAFPLLRDRGSRIAGGVAIVVIFGAAAALYPLWSNFDWHAAPPSSRISSTEILGMVSKLEQRLKEHPDDALGWVMLGRSYVALERMDAAVEAYHRAHLLDPKNVDATLGLGEALSLRTGGDVTAQSGELFEEALTLAPDNPKALLYSGFAALERGDRQTAKVRWQALKNLNPPPQIVAMLDARIAELDGPPETVAAAAPAEAVVSLRIAPALQTKVSAETPLFIFAREPGSAAGPPLAAKRLTSAVIGTDIRLTSADSMIPGRVLKTGHKVSITARVSFAGQPLPAAGDLYGEVTYDVGRDTSRELIIDRVAQ